MKQAKIIIILLSLILLFYGCGGGDGGSVISSITPTTNNTVIIPDTTKLLDDSTIQSLTSISEDKSILTFNQPTSTLQSLAVGNIVVSGVTNSTPYGLLRKITKIEQKGSQFVVTTGPATLTEAIDQANIQFTEKLTSKDVKLINPLKDGIEVTQSEDGFYINIDTKLKGNYGSEVELKGSVYLEPEIYFGFGKSSNQKISSAYAQIVLKEITKLEVKGAFAGELNSKVPIANIKMAPITIMAGWFPIVLLPDLVVNVGAEGNVSVGLSSNITQTMTLMGGVRYNPSDNSFKPESNITNTYEWSQPKITGEAEIKPYVSVQPEILIYGLTGPYLEIKAYLLLKIEKEIPTYRFAEYPILQAQADPLKWELYIGIGADIGWQADILGLGSCEFKDIIGIRELIANSGSVIPTNLPSAHEKIYFTRSNDIYTINPDGTNETRLSNSGKFVSPVLSPDGKKMVFVSDPQEGINGILYGKLGIANSDGSNIKIISNYNYWNFSGADWFPDSQTFRYEKDILDLNGTKVKEIPITGDLVSPSTKLSPDGTKIVYTTSSQSSGTTTINNTVLVSSLNGTNTQSLLSYTTEPTESNFLVNAWAPNGKELAVSMYDSIKGPMLWYVNLENNTKKLLVNRAYVNAWTRDGKKIIYSGNRIINSDGTGDAQLVSGYYSCLSPDGKNMIYSSNSDMWIYNFDTQNTKKLTSNGSALGWITQGVVVIVTRTKNN